MSGAVVGLLLIGLLGDGLFRLLRRAGWLGGLGAAEGIGLRLLLALASIPWLCVGMDLAGIRIGRLSLGAAGAVLATAGFLLDARRPAAGARAGPAHREELRSLLGSPAAALLALAILTLPFFSFMHLAHTPVQAYDALVGYDAVGKVLSYEGKLRSTLFSEMRFNAQCVYPPFTACNQGYGYLFWPGVPRLWVSLVALGFALAMWGRVRRWTSSPTAAGLAVFLTFLPPELAFHLTVGQTDLPSMAFTALAFFSVVDFLRGREGVAPAALYILLANTIRSENVMFALALGAVVLLSGRRPRWGAALIALPAVAYFGFWNLYFVRHLIGYDPAQHFRATLTFDAGRLREVLDQAASIIAEKGIFGELVWVIAALPLLWALGRWGRRRDWWRSVPDPGVTGRLLVVMSVALVFYLPYFYQWDPQLNPIWTMQHTFKRGFFRFVPGIVAALIASPPVLAIVRRCDAHPGAAGTSGERRFS